LDTFKLEEVELDGTEDDVIALSKAFRGHDYLEEFHVINVTLTDSTLTLDQVVSLMLVTVPGLTLIKLEKVPVTASALATVAYCSSLKALLVPNSGLTDKDAIKLAQAVTQSASIQLIDITGNDLTDLRGVAFFTALNKNTSIKRFVSRVTARLVASSAASLTPLCASGLGAWPRRLNQVFRYS
jgi:hypothetical protein